MQLGRALREWRQLARPTAAPNSTYPVPQEASLVIPLGYSPKAKRTDRRIAVFCHAYYALEFADALFTYLQNLPRLADVYFTTDSTSKAQFLAKHFSSHPRIGHLKVVVSENRGRDIYPKLSLMKQYHSLYDFVLHIHTKKSSHAEQLQGWREFLWDHLLGSHEIAGSILEVFEGCRDVGMIAPQHFPSIRPWANWGDCRDIAIPFATRMGVDITAVQAIDFPSGSMFWARPQALSPIFSLDLKATDFPDEMGQLSHTAAHALERLFFLSCEASGLKWLKVAMPRWHAGSIGLQTASSRHIVRRFVTRRNVVLAT